ncbi:hypothetical protein RA274_28360, partial [Pseudomonas syringae pv. tagetis]|uniref:hypothetical protein n=1 Tax=Pseudomonas syringae group genomosp. 7 TaxID=251699 RepID=UPI0037705C6D
GGVVDGCCRFGLWYFWTGFEGFDAVVPVVRFLDAPEDFVVIKHDFDKACPERIVRPAAADLMDVQAEDKVGDRDIFQQAQTP